MRRWYQKVFHVWGTVVGYLLLALLLTWPLVRLFTTHAPGDGSDDPAIIWNLWWVRYALFNGINPLQSDFMFWPLGVNLAFYTLTTLNALLTLPLQLTIGLIASNSMLIWFELVIGALGAFLLARRLTGGWWGPFLAGVIFSFAHSRFVYLSLGQFNIAGSHWVPWYALALWRLERTGRGRDTIMATLFLLANGWTEFTYASFLVLFTALHWLWHRIDDVRQGRWSRAWRQTGHHLAVGMLFAAGLMPVFWTMVQTLRTQGDFLVEGLGFANVFSNDVLGFFVPSHLHPLVGRWIADTFDFAYLNFAYLGYVPLLLALVALRSHRVRRQAGFWAVAVLTFSVLSLGPTLRVNGTEIEAPLPFDLMLQLPIFKANRYPSRFGVMIALGLAVLAAYGLKVVRERYVARPAYAAFLSAIFTAFFLAETAAIPLPLSDFRVPPFYEALRERNTTAVLEIPMAWRNGFRVTGPLDNTFMFAQFYQTTHEKRLLNGNTSRNPAFLFQYFTEAPLLNSLLALETGHELPAGRKAFDQTVAAGALQLLGIKEIVVHTPTRDDPAVSPGATIPYLKSVLSLQQWHDGDRHDAWHVDLPPLPSAVTIDAGVPLARLHYGEGWSAVPPFERRPRTPPLAWAQERRADLFVALDGTADRLRFRAYSPVTQQLTLRANTGPRVQITLQAGRHDYETRLPGLVAGHNRVQLSFEHLIPLQEIPARQQQIGDTSVTAPVPIVVESAGKDVGDLAHIYVNGESVAMNAVGYNVVVIHPRTGEVIVSQNFNTAFEEQASQALADFVKQVPEGFIVAAAGKDTLDWPAAQGGPAWLREEAVTALRTIGGTASLRGTFRWSHALLGVKGATPGTALEDVSAIRPARVWAGAPVTSPHVAAGFAWFRFSQ